MAKSDDFIKKYGGQTKKSTADDFISRYSDDAYIRSVAERLAPVARAQAPDHYTSGSGKKGWKDYTAAKKQKEEENPWVSMILKNFGNNPDSTLSGPTFSQVADEYRRDTSWKAPNSQWNDAERDIFGYLYDSDRDASECYAAEVNDAIAMLQKQEQQSGIAQAAVSDPVKHTAGALLTAPLGMMDYLDNLAERSGRGRITEKNIVSPFEYSQTATGAIAQNLNGVDAFGVAHNVLPEEIPVIGGKGWGDVYGLGFSAAQSMIGGKLLGQANTLMSFFGSAAAAGIDDAKSRGATDDQAVAFGSISGAAEVLTEIIPLDNLMNIGAASTWKGLFFDIIKQGGEEFLGEGLNSVITSVADNLVLQDKSEFELLKSQYMQNGLSAEDAEKRAFRDIVENIAFDALGGFATGSTSASILGGAQTVLYRNAQNKMNTELYSGEQEALVSEALESNPKDEFAQKMKGKLDDGKDLSGNQLGRLVHATDTAKIQQAAANRLTELGETGDVRAISAALAKRFTGEKLSRAETNTIANSKYGRRVSNEMNPANIGSGDYSSDWVQQIGTRRINDDAYNQALMDLAEEMSGADASRANPAQVSEEITPAAETAEAKTESAPQRQYEASKTGTQTYIPTGEAVKIQEIASIADGKMMLKLEDGRTVEAKDVAYANQGEAVIYESVAKMGANPAAGNALVKGYMPESGVRPEVYAHGIREAYRYGQYNYADVAKGPFSSMLTQQQRNNAYRLGQIFSENQVAQAQATVKKTAAVAKNATTTGKVHFEGDRSRLTERQNTSLSTLETVADALGVQIYVFESELGDNGRRIGANGWYDPRDNSIHIDLHAGAAGEGTMLFTAAHELTHYVKQWSPEKFKTLSDFLMKEYGENGVSVDKLVYAQIQKAKDHNRTIDYDTAFEEVIADSMETMLADGKVVEKLAKLKQQDKSLWQKVKDFIGELAAKIREVYEALAPDSVEGRYVAEMKDSIEKLEQMFAEALVEASENYQMTEKTTTQEGGDIKFSIKNTSKMSLEEQLKLYYKGKLKTSDALYFGVTPGSIAESGLEALPLVFPTSDFKKSTQDKHNVPRRAIKALNTNLGKALFSF